ncbi:MAG: bifunctional phosphoribosyl-AMP cyclohydrolase/phosphoribosyl-ATP diphosphatase HisIE [SAR202 cluster bacterium]|nr:bifunctional phosphoribosyl-AMP cyclohydrolase/phosphoribosyl-ATP pyrophosphatase [Chloroflexota bacterium]MQG22332.1 bifunctional phosphoribosyl-AMP cyclohydrolase/phosphoribosyl-ATP diphosphatase HisIE [SAR202 cluster bacterium]
MSLIKFDSRGLIPAIIQHVDTNEVLMMAFMNSDSIEKTFESGDVWFYSRSREELWHKGKTSGNYLKLKSFSIDCDGDVILIKVMPEGPACHTGEISCFHAEVDDTKTLNLTTILDARVIEELFDVIEERSNSYDEDSYTAKLLSGDVSRIAQKVVEEAGEVAIAGVQSNQKELVEEVVDLLYHLLVLIKSNDVSLQDVWEVLKSRRR